MSIISDAEIAGYMNWRGPGAYTQHAMKRIKRIVDEVERRVKGPMQAEIDRLMLEYCPGEMTPEQKAEWQRHQRPVATIDTPEKPVDETPENRHDGCGHCNNPLYAGTKCKNCGKEHRHRYAGSFGE